MLKNRVEIELDILIKIINDKVYKFISIYNRRPQFIIVPLYLSQFLKTYNGVYFNFENKEIQTLLGLYVIPTITKNNIEEIEVL